MGVPAGKVTTFGLVGAYLEVMPRHVSFLLAKLTQEERRQIPWYRVVGAEGKLSTTSSARLSEQIKHLKAEGVEVVNNRVVDFERHLHTWPQWVAAPGRDRRGPYSDPGTPLLFPPIQKGKENS